VIGGVVKEVVITEGDGEEKGTSRLSELETRNCIEGDGVMGETGTELEGAAIVGKLELIGIGDWKEEEGKSRDSELEIEKMNDEEKTVEVEGKRISQMTPV
jgi:hypothetical protein